MGFDANSDDRNVRFIQSRRVDARDERRPEVLWREGRGGRILIKQNLL
jgi:hypothetical protein